MTKLEAEQETVRRWYLLPPHLRETYEQAEAYAIRLDRELDFPSVTERRRLIAAWLIRDRNSPTAASWEKVALAVLFIMVLDGRGLAERWHIPAFPIAALGLLAIAGARAWRELAQRPRLLRKENFLALVEAKAEQQQ